jgi:hypothetical protein
MIPVKTAKLAEAGYGASRGIMREASGLLDKYPVEGRVDISEILRLCDGNNDVFEIKILLDGQMKDGESKLADIVNTVKILGELGYVDL